MRGARKGKGQAFKQPHKRIHGMTPLCARLGLSRPGSACFSLIWKRRRHCTCHIRTLNSSYRCTRSARSMGFLPRKIFRQDQSDNDITQPNDYQRVSYSVSGCTLNPYVYTLCANTCAFFGELRNNRTVELHHTFTKLTS